VDTAHRGPRRHRAVIGAILAGLASLPLAACRDHDPRLSRRPDWRWDPRAAPPAVGGCRGSLLAVSESLGLIVLFRDLGKRRSRLQDRCRSRATFHKITDAGQIGHLGYRVRLRVITAATFSTVLVSEPANQARETPLGAGQCYAVQRVEQHG
jgi:hypothetical protein